MLHTVELLVLFIVAVGGFLAYLLLKRPDEVSVIKTGIATAETDAQAAGVKLEADAKAAKVNIDAEVARVAKAADAALAKL